MELNSRERARAAESMADSGMMKEPIEFRVARSDDLNGINVLIETIGFELGLHTLRLYYETSDHSWRVAANSRGEIVAFDGNHVLPLNGITYAFNMCVNDKYQNRGIIRRIGSIYSPQPRIGNATAKGMARFPQMQKYDSKFVGYHGCPRVNLLPRASCNSDKYGEKRPAAMTITTVRSEQDIRKVLAFDRESVFRLDRERFMRAWCAESKSATNQPYARTMMAESNGRVVGFGVIRRFSDSYGLQPLYADNADVVEKLLTALVRSFVEECGREAKLFVYFDAKNRFVMRFVRGQMFQQYNCEMRYYARGAVVIKDYCSFDKVYAMSEHWPV